MKRLLKAHEVLDIYSRYWAQEDIWDIADLHRVSQATVYRIGRGASHASLTGHQSQRCNRRRLKLPSNLVELYSQYSLEMLALEFGVARASVRAELRRRGAEIRTPRSREARQMAARHYGRRLEIYVERGA